MNSTSDDLSTLREALAEAKTDLRLSEQENALAQKEIAELQVECEELSEELDRVRADLVSRQLEWTDTHTILLRDTESARRQMREYFDKYVELLMFLDQLRALGDRWWMTPEIERRMNQSAKILERELKSTGDWDSYVVRREFR